MHSKGIETVLLKVAVRVRKEVPTATTFTIWVKARVKRTWSRNSMKKKVCTHTNLINSKVVQVIIQLGNDILRNLGVEEPIDDVAVFFR